MGYLVAQDESDLGFRMSHLAHAASKSERPDVVALGRHRDAAPVGELPRIAVVSKEAARVRVEVKDLLPRGGIVVIPARAGDPRIAREPVEDPSDGLGGVVAAGRAGRPAIVIGADGEDAKKDAQES